MQCFFALGSSHPLPDLVAHHMKVVTAFARDCDQGVSNLSQISQHNKHTQATVISWVFAGRTCAIEMYLAYAADVVVGYVPSPCSHRIPRLDLDLHSRTTTPGSSCANSLQMDLVNGCTLEKQTLLSQGVYFQRRVASDGKHLNGGGGFTCLELPYQFSTIVKAYHHSIRPELITNPSF